MQIHFYTKINLRNKFIFGCKKTGLLGTMATKILGTKRLKEVTLRAAMASLKQSVCCYLNNEKGVGQSFQMRKGLRLCRRMALLGNTVHSHACPHVSMVRISALEQNGRAEPSNRCNSSK